MKQRVTAIALSLLAGAGLAFGSTEHHVVRHAKGHATPKTAARPQAAPRTALQRVGVNGHAHYVRRTLAYHSYERFTTSSFADNLTTGDVTTGEDLTVRAAAVEALGNMNGTGLAIDPSHGRILAMVNQRLAGSAGAEPCPTIK